VPVQASLAEREGGSPDQLSAGQLVAASALSKMVASTVTYPHEVSLNGWVAGCREEYIAAFDV
jgi:hypothetical protein